MAMQGGGGGWGGGQGGPPMGGYPQGGPPQGGYPQQQGGYPQQQSGPPQGGYPQQGVPQQAHQHSMANTWCQACARQAPVKQVTFMQNVGLLVVRFPKTVSGQLCRRCIGSFFWRMTLISFFFGWWGIISFFYTLVGIPVNIVNYLGALGLPDE